MRNGIGANRTVARWRALVLVLALLGAGCQTEVSEPESDAGALFGTVTLIGSDGPPNPTGVRVLLYTSIANYENRVSAYSTTLQRIQGAERAYSYEFAQVPAGEYYLEACFDFGCGVHKSAESGAPLPVRVVPGSTKLNFGI